MQTRRFLAPLLLAAAAGGCAVGPNYKPPQIQAPPTWVSLDANPATQPAGPTTQPVGPTTRPANLATWWKTLNDPVLDSLIERAAASNLDLRVALARVVQARATKGVVAADLWPQVNLGGSYSYRGGSRNAGPKTSGVQGIGKQARNAVINSAVRTYTLGQFAGSGTTSGATGAALGLSASPGAAVASTINNTVAGLLQGPGPSVSRDQSLFQAGFDATWELDVFGGTRRAVEAAIDDIAAADAGSRNTLITLFSEVALNYVQLRGNQRRLAIALDNIRLQQESVDITQQRKGVGFESELAVAQAQTLLASTQSQVPALRSAIKQNIYQLSILLALPPGALLPELEEPTAIPKVPDEVPMGLPSDLLRRRPDIRVAERQLAAATARIGQAIADLFPKFSLTGSIGPSSRTLRHFFDEQSLSWSVGPGVTWPIFDGWRIRSNIAVQNALEEEALATYEQTVLIAFQDVENSLTAYMEEQVRYKSLAEAVRASQLSTDLSTELFAHGETNFLNVLESQRALYASQDQLIVSETTVITNLISLYKALGGGWETLAACEGPVILPQAAEGDKNPMPATAPST